MGVNRAGVVGGGAEPAGQPGAGGRQAQPRRTAAAGAGAPLGRRGRRRRSPRWMPAHGAASTWCWPIAAARSSSAASATAARRRSRWPPACTWSPRTTRTIRKARASPGTWRGSGPLAPPEPGDWRAWQDILADRIRRAGRADQRGAAWRLRHRLLLAAGAAARRPADLAVRRRPAATRRRSVPSPWALQAHDRRGVAVRPCAAISSLPTPPAGRDGVPPRRGS